MSSLRDSLSRIKKRPLQGLGSDAEAVVRFGWLGAEGRLPRLATPGVADLDPVAWAGGNRERVEAELARTGGILFRGFAVDSAQQLESFSAALAPDLMDYTERSTVRSEVGGKVYTSTEYPPDQQIPLHNELSYAHTWPQRIWFFCQQPAATGGETPIADSRQVYQLLDPAVRQRFIDRQVLYVRNFAPGWGLGWQQVFQTEDRAEVDAFCRAAGIATEWGEEDRLRTRALRPAVTAHPRSGEPVWFNQANVHHPSSLPSDLRSTLEGQLAHDELPFNTLYGDGTPIPAADIEAVQRAYAEAAVSFPWQQGDLLMLDNVMVAHGRKAFTGPRRILVTMA